MKEHLIVSAVCIALGLGSSGQARDNDRDEAHAVFVMTNSARHNEILAYHGGPGDTLEQSGRFDTGGRGSSGTAIRWALKDLSL